MAIQFIDLCSGIGGFHSGLMATGHYECVGHAEIDPNAAKAYKAIYGEEGGLNYNCQVTIAGGFAPTSGRQSLIRQKQNCFVWAMTGSRSIALQAATFLSSQTLNPTSDTQALCG